MAFHQTWYWIWFGIVDDQISLIPDDKVSKYQWIFTKLGMCIDVVVCFWIARGQISSTFDRVICPQHICILLSGK